MLHPDSLLLWPTWHTVLVLRPAHWGDDRRGFAGAVPAADHKGLGRTREGVLYDRGQLRHLLPSKSRVAKLAKLTDFMQNFANFWRARSRLYQNEILQENTRLTAFFKLYKICILLHLWNPIEKPRKALRASVLWTKHTAPEKKPSDRSSFCTFGPLA